jgi:hypothetical protein
MRQPPCTALLVAVPLLLVTACAPRRCGRRPAGTSRTHGVTSTNASGRQSGYFGTGIVGALNMADFQKRCLRAKGYREVPADATPST